MLPAFFIGLPSTPLEPSPGMSWREVNEEMERMERIVGEMEDEATEGNAIEGIESGDGQQGREQEVAGEDQDDKEED